MMDLGDEGVFRMENGDWQIRKAGSAGETGLDCLPGANPDHASVAYTSQAL